jgi:hypothetical protein
LAGRCVSQRLSEGGSKENLETPRQGSDLKLLGGGWLLALRFDLVQAVHLNLGIVITDLFVVLDRLAASGPVHRLQIEFRCEHDFSPVKVFPCGYLRVQSPFSIKFAAVLP